jgi:hypothetical protein
MGEFYSGVNIVGMVKETIEVFFRLGPLHVNVVYETKPGKWLVHNDGIEACREAWDQRAVKEPPTECLVQLLTLVLKHNNFIFNGEHFLQINGTAGNRRIRDFFCGVPIC